MMYSRKEGTTGSAARLLALAVFHGWIAICAASPGPKSQVPPYAGPWVPAELVASPSAELFASGSAELSTSPSVELFASGSAELSTSPSVGLVAFRSIGVPASPSASPSTELPNFVWITAEDMSADLGAFGDPYATTPNLDRLAEDGVRYTHAFATAPVCSPARFTLITGIYATSAGTQGLRSQAPIPEDVTGFPTFLREIGYYTTNNVKTDYNTADEARLIAESWDDSSPTAHWRGREPDQPFFAVFNHMHTHQSRISFLDVEFDELDGKLGRHDPAEAPLPPYYPDEPEVRETVARYYDAIEAMDESAGAILHQLEEDGVADNTIVFFYGDHGVGLPRGKRVLYDSGQRVALIIRFPPKWQHLAPGPPGSATDRLVSFVDFAPTVLSIAGSPVPQYMQGRAFLGDGEAERRTVVFGARDRVDEAYDVARVVRDDRYLYIRHYHPHRSWHQPEFFSDQAPMRQAITRRLEEGTLNEVQLSYAGPTRPLEELFDTTTDPHQIRNLASPASASAEFDGVLDQMRRRLREWQLETRDLGFMPEGLALRMSRELDPTPLEFGRDDALYPLERVLETAELVGDGRSASVLIERLDDPDASIRYWAAVGLGAAARIDPAAMIDATATVDGTDDIATLVLQALAKALDDPVPEVRVAAAEALIAAEEALVAEDEAAIAEVDAAISEDEAAVAEDDAAIAEDDASVAEDDARFAESNADAALATLVGVLETGDSHAVLMAARTLQLLGPKAEPAESAMKRTLERAMADQSVYGVNALYIGFALRTALSLTDGSTEVY